MPLFDHFGFLAPYYDRAIPLKYSQKLIELIDLPTQGKLLDAGGGTGRVAQQLNGLASTIVIADASIDMLRQAYRKRGLRTVGSHTELLPFFDEAFDRVIMVDALHHVCDHKESIAEMYRVLRPGGRIVIEEPDVRKVSVKIMAVAERFALMRSHFINPHRISEMCEQLHLRTQIHLDGINAWVIADKD